MAEWEKKVRKVLGDNGFAFHHHSRGDHDVWYKPGTNLKVTVDSKIRSRHMANGILKEVGIDYHF
jgi:predicted RNA binding protein YcfA (HicA-like mRNA interferase family)